MKHIIPYLSIFYLISNATLYGQDTSKVSSLKDKFALQFQVSGLYLYSFQGSNLSCKYHIGNASAWRLGVGLSGSTDLRNEINNVVTTNDEHLSININVQYLQYVKSVNDISLYLGTGPYYSRNFSKSARWQYRDNNWSLGLTGIIGMEWYFNNSMSLSGEYGISANYNVSKYINSDGTETTDSQSVNVGSGNQVKIGLSVYL